ncbi:hypothetical protein [Sporosarcina sp. Te-1]|uniref:hypothetical protein n=1 Tax=Sporosarcina sp. Te-1 TaxID=2818390 RepID=UPI001A9FD98A|nr:hypothetical protein [Sporosarcina sp. Te-1]QTD42342.1 hypothetical protein J3U78_05860 [Sporosarcina sp. Te-1]
MSHPMINQVTGGVLTQNNSKPIVLREGQMFHGSIKQLFPGQMAEVQIGGTKMLARLEVPMKAGDAYYFQVESVEPELQLKIISGPMQSGESLGKQMASLMESMDLPKTKEMQSLLAFMLKNKIPISREQLIQAEKLLGAVPDKQQSAALSTVVKLMELKLSLTETNFRSLLGVVAKESMHPLLQALQNSLIEDTVIPASTKNSILTALSAVTKDGREAAAKLMLNEALLTLIDRKVPNEERFQLLQWLKKADLLPARTSLANFQNVLQSLLTNGPSRELSAFSAPPSPIRADGAVEVKTDVGGQQTSPVGSAERIVAILQSVLSSSGKEPTAVDALKNELRLATWLTSDQKASIIRTMDRLHSTPAGSNAEPLQRLNEMVTRAVVEHRIAEPLMQDKDPIVSLLTGSKPGQEISRLVTLAEASADSAVQRLASDVNTKLADALNGNMIKEAMQTIAKTFGFHYEAGLAGKESDVGQLAQSLKPQLVSLIHNPATPSAVRDLAETVIARFNGPSLLSGETSLNYQLIMQVPLSFFGKRIDATLQWNGRMKDNEQIDPDYARILFYLDLEALDKTVIDMQVQNRIVTVTIFNENMEVKPLGELFAEKLRIGLENADYRLSGVFFKQFAEEMKKKPVEQNRENGIDFRI